MTKGNEESVDGQLFRWWIELRDLRDDTARRPPLTWVGKIPLVSKGKAADQPSTVEMHVQDGSRNWVAADLSDLSAQLRALYPDGTFERTLRSERDMEAEQRHRAAIEELARILARAVVDGYARRFRGRRCHADLS